MFKPTLPSMNGSDSNSFPLEARKNNGQYFLILPVIFRALVRASREKIISNLAAFIGGKLCFKYLICLVAFPVLMSAHDDFEFVEYEQKPNILDVKEADVFFEATIYDKAIPLYQKFLTQISPNSESHNRVRMRLIQAYYFNAQYLLVIKEITDMSTSQKVPNEGLYFLGMSHIKLKQDDKAIEAFLKYLSLKNKEPQSRIDKVYFELASANFRLGKLSDAKEQFEAICRRSTKSQLFFFCHLYLIQIVLTEEKYEHAERMINSLSQQLSTSDRLHFALDFLRGELAFNQKNYSQAIEFLEKGIPSRNPEKAEWYADALFLLGWSYLEEAKNPSNNIFVESAEKVFRKLVGIFPSDEAYLALGQALLVKGTLLNDQSAYVELERLLSDPAKFNKNDSLQYAFLLRAEASFLYPDRKKFFHQLTQESNSNSILFAKAWYFRGLNELQEGKTKAEKGDSGKIYFDQAALALDRAFELLYLKDNRFAAQTLKAHIQTLCCQNDRQALLKALSLVSQLLNVYRTELFFKLEEPDEVYFLQGFAAAHLAEEEEETTYFVIAEQSLQHCIETYRQSRFRDEALKVLGILYYHKQQYANAKEAFVTLVTTNPTSKYADESWYWAANSLEAAGGESVEIQQYRKNVYENFPTSLLAAEAYLRCYSFKEYLQGNPEAIEHLHSFEKNYPESPYLIDAHYLIALHACQKDLEYSGSPNKAAIEVLDKLESSFEYLFSQNKIPNDSLPHICLVRYRAGLEKANLFMKAAENSSNHETKISFLKRSEEILSNIRNEMTDQQHPKSLPLVGQKGYDHLQEETNFLLIKCLIKSGNITPAEKLIAQMMEKYQSTKITRGYFLSRIWYEQGFLAKQRQEYLLALQCFKQAEESCKGKILSSDELLDLWIEQSLCYQSIGKEDDAMLILSRIINYDAVSSLRLKAMFLRAEIYEHQGRLELARKQLEAVAKKGGEWASKAQIKLEERYIYE